MTTAQYRHLYKMCMIAQMRVDDDEWYRIAEIMHIIRKLGHMYMWLDK